MSELTPKQRRLHGEANLNEFFRTVEPELKAHASGDVAIAAMFPFPLPTL